MSARSDRGERKARELAVGLYLTGNISSRRERKRCTSLINKMWD